MTKSLEIFLKMTDKQKEDVVEMVEDGIDSDVAVKQVLEKGDGDD